MAKQVINIGTTANDGTGDPARDAFDKCNDNFTELYTGSAVTEGTAVKSTGETGGTKFLREDGDGTSSWQAIPAPEGTSVLSTGPVTDGYVLTADGAGGAAWEAGGGSVDWSTTQTTTGDFTFKLSDAAGASKLSLLDSGDVEAFSVTSDGDVTVGNGTDGATILVERIGNTNDVMFATGATNRGLGEYFSSPTMYHNGQRVMTWQEGNGAVLSQVDEYFAWRNKGTKIYSDADNQIDQRNSTNAQTYNIYGTYTDASNFSRLSIGYTDSTGALIESNALGTGTAGNITFKLPDAAGASKLSLTDSADAEVFSVDSDGAVDAAGDVSVPSNKSFWSGTDRIVSNGSYLQIVGGGAHSTSVSSAGVRVKSDGYFSITSGTPNSTPDIYLYRDAAGTLALRNSTNAQALNIYNTYTDASNYERGFLKWDTNIFEVGAEVAGTGTARDVHVKTSTSQEVRLYSGVSGIGWNGNVNTWYPLSDGVTDLGTTSKRYAITYTDTVAITNYAEIDSGYTVATLPTGSVGMIARVTDASSPSIGSTVTGGGSAYALVNYNGSNWTVIGV